MLYEYRCKKCNRIVELQRRVKNIYDDYVCPFCGKKNSGEKTKIISKSSFILKGAGWFRKSNTDIPEPSGDYSITQNEIDRNQQLEKEKVSEIDKEIFGMTFD